MMSERIREESPRVLYPVSQSPVENLRPKLSYGHLKNRCFRIRSTALRSTSFSFYSTRIAAGSPSNVEDDIEQELDLNEYVGRNSNTIFCLQVEGDSMIGAGIHNNDILVVDRSIEPANGKIVIASLNAEFTVKRLKLEGDEVMLMPENPAYSPILITEETDFKIWGVVVHVIHSLD